MSDRTIVKSRDKAVGLILACAALAGLATGCTGLTKPGRTASGEGVQLTQLADRLRVEINGHVFTEYFFRGVTRPYCYPLIGPGGVGMTRDWPMKSTPGDSQDHPHQRSFFYAVGDVNGQNFWAELPGCGRTIHVGFTEIKSGRDAGVIRERNQWVAANGQVICTDHRTLRIYNRPDNERLFDFEITIKASNGPLTFGDTKEGVMALRLAESMRLKPSKENAGKPPGHIVNSEGVRDDDAWGKRAAWCDCYGLVDNKTVGVAVFDHPNNPRHPTWWHVRDYALLAANPFGQHDFENLPDAHAGDLIVAAGQSVTFRYRFYIHEGDERQARVAEHFADYAKTAR